MFETNRQEIQRAVLLAADIGEYDVNMSLDELSELAQTAGAQTAAKVSQKRTGYDPATCVGAGCLEEVKEFCQNDGANLIIFDGELSASQVRNIENITGVEVIDRTTLILDIFAQRAVTSAGRLQVELAQQKYRLPRLGGQGNVLSRLGGGIGTRGPGESQLESDRRHVRRRITALEKQLKELEGQRDLLRSRRKKSGVPCVAIVGYTNVGKSTLLNALTNAGVLAEDKLFATLDPTARALELPDGRTVMLIDTVGLVRRLPHQLVEAFHSTLEEAVQADLLLNVCDISSPEVQEQISVTEEVIRELREKSKDRRETEEKPILTVLNKCDLVEDCPVPVNEKVAVISAAAGTGLEELLHKIAALLEKTQTRLWLEIPFEKGHLLGLIRQEGRIFSEEYTEKGTRVDALVDRRALPQVEQFRVE
ncbi:MAG: GTPase HflX [Oscillospiraceae bacterium]|nr:GTPase HflX [Oscillospiraceae bacterium]